MPVSIRYIRGSTTSRRLHLWFKQRLNTMIFSKKCSFHSLSPSENLKRFAIQSRRIDSLLSQTFSAISPFWLQFHVQHLIRAITSNFSTKLWPSQSQITMKFLTKTSSPSECFSTCSTSELSFIAGRPFSSTRHLSLSPHSTRSNSTSHRPCSSSSSHSHSSTLTSSQRALPESAWCRVRSQSCSLAVTLCRTLSTSRS